MLITKRLMLSVMPVSEQARQNQLANARRGPSDSDLALAESVSDPWLVDLLLKGPDRSLLSDEMTPPVTRGTADAREKTGSRPASHNIPDA